MIEFRNRGIFYEAVTNQILDDLVAACQPRRMTVVGDFSVRGGIKTVVTASLPGAVTHRVPIEDALDLHAFAPRDIKSVVEEYVNAAHEAGLREVRLIHGRGKGIQRGIVQQALERHPLVESSGTRPRPTSARPSPGFVKIDDAWPGRGLANSAHFAPRRRRIRPLRARNGPCTSLPRCAERTGPLRAGDVVRIRDERWRIVTPCATRRCGDHRGRRLRRRESNHARTLSSSVRADRAPAFVARAAGRSPGPMASRRPARACGRDALLDVAFATAAHANLTLIPFQLEPALALVGGHGCRFLIADDVGLGKTVQAGVMIAEVLARQPGRAGAGRRPAALREQWRHELSARFRLDADVFDAAGVARIAADLPPAINPWSLPRIVVTSIDYIKRPEVMRSIETLIWDFVAFDEAHNLAGRSDRAAAAQAVGAARACRGAADGDAAFRRRRGVPEAVRHRRHARRLSAC